MSEPLEHHLNVVARALMRGTVVPLLGAGANLCDRTGPGWTDGLPSGAELSELLAESFGYPMNDKWDLLRVAQFVDVDVGLEDLYQRLHDLFDKQYEPTSLHTLLASLPARRERQGCGRSPLLVVTTNYDDLMEQAFEAAEEPYDVIVYLAQGEDRGRLAHRLPNGELHPIDAPETYGALAPDTRSVVLKLHGAVDRGDGGGQDSYVITEDDYLQYLMHTNASQLVPASVLSLLARRHFLFLGYSLRDWNLRVFLNRIWSNRVRGVRSWAVQRDPDAVADGLWNRHNVDVRHFELREWVDGMDDVLEKLASEPART
jgi:hypothetical protein